MIDVNDVSRDFKIYIEAKGLRAKLHSVFVRDYEIKHAVDHISFHIDKGEIVGYVGPNGAGKSTTIKMLSGILSPTSGQIVVDGISPHLQRIKNARSIGVVFGQRSQLYWDLPIRDSFLLHQKMYDIDKETFERNTKLFIDVLQMETFLNQPVRQLSLGQKMRANIAISLLHSPKIIYLDEPTIGLEIVAKARIRDFILEINRKQKTTFILTTHDMDDIETVCGRLIMINYGRVMYDGSLSDFKEKHGDQYMLSIVVDTFVVIDHPGIHVQEGVGGNVNLLCNRRLISVAEAVSLVTQLYHVRDIKIIESDVESILKEMYRQ